MLMGGADPPQCSGPNEFDAGEARQQIMAVDIAELRSLPREEKLRLVNMLWDDLHASAVVRFSDAEMDEIRRRDREMQEHPERALTLDQMWAKIDEKR